LSRVAWIYICLLPALIVMAIVNMTQGAVPIPISELIPILAGKGDSHFEYILMNYRLPRLLLAVMVGGGLALAGVILQNIIRNPLASPDVIGLSKGSGLAAVIVIVLLPNAPAGMIPWAAFLGASSVGMLLFIISLKLHVRPAALALSGMALGTAAGAGIQYITVKHMDDANTALLWLAGSLWGRTWEHVLMLLPWIAVLVPTILFMSRHMDLLNLGDDIAEGLGIPVTKTRVILLGIAVCLTGASVAVSGTIGFVGLVAPHMARRIVGSLHRQLLPISAMLGALLVMTADMIGRVVIVPREIPVGIVTAIIGAPYFLYLLRRSIKNK